MDWINSNSGIITLVAAIIIIVLICITVWIAYGIRNRIGVQKLNFIGFYSEDPQTHERFASFMIGNNSLNDVALAEAGLQNGRVNFNFTETVKARAMGDGGRLAALQRSSVKFNLTVDELKSVLYERKGKKVLKTLRVYAVDLTGNVYRGKVRAVRKLLAEVLAEEKRNNKVPLLRRVSQLFKKHKKVKENDAEEGVKDVSPEEPVGAAKEEFCGALPAAQTGETAAADADCVSKEDADVSAEDTVTADKTGGISENGSEEGAQSDGSNGDIAADGSEKGSNGDISAVADGAAETDGQ